MLGFHLARFVNSSYRKGREGSGEKDGLCMCTENISILQILLSDLSMHLLDHCSKFYASI